MFNFEQSVHEWQRQMLAAGIQTPVPLEELESHLRDEVKRRMTSGSSAQEAFDAAVQQLGEARTLKTEFTKVSGASARKRELGWVYCCALGVLAGLAGVYVLNQVVSQPLTFVEQALGAAACFMFPLATLGWRQAYRFLPALPQNRRGIIFLLSLVAGFLCTAALQANLIEPLRDSHPGTFAVAFLWGWIPSVLGANAIFGLNEAARREFGHA